MNHHTANIAELIHALGREGPGRFVLQPGRHLVGQTIVVRDGQSLILQDCVLERAATLAGNLQDVIRVEGDDASVRGGTIVTADSWWRRDLPARGPHGYCDLAVRKGRGIEIDGLTIRNTGGVVSVPDSTPADYYKLPYGPDACISIGVWEKDARETVSRVRITNCRCQRSTWGHFVQVARCEDVTIGNCRAAGGLFLCRKDGTVFRRWVDVDAPELIRPLFNPAGSSLFVANMTQDGFRGYGGSRNVTIAVSKASACRAGFQPGYAGPYGDSPDWSFLHCQASHCCGPAFALLNSPRARVQGCVTNRCFNTALFVRQGSDRVNVEGFLCLGNDQRRLLVNDETDYGSLGAEIDWGGDHGHLSGCAGYSPCEQMSYRLPGLQGVIGMRTPGADNTIQGPSITGSDGLTLAIFWYQERGNVYTPGIPAE